MKITVASQSATDYGKRVLSTSDDAVLPALSLFAKEKKYADLCFRDIYVSSDWIYEISSISSHFMSTGMLAISGKYNPKSESAFLKRAERMNIVKLDTDILWNEAKFNSVMNSLFCDNNNLY